ncbi:DUF2442 domain-containing protein [Trinickia mobilis]|uniref:DUF2442 domain-containing protein n=1 Tax=Trinickia mobilis TaxID=2816356 RepID=UPI001A8E1530|nr:DUF2442 domain-containing protein [Trinickia mobilis]
MGRARATAVRLDEAEFVVSLADGRELHVPLAWFPRLLSATPAQRASVRISLSGSGLHWDELDEDINVDGLLNGIGNLSQR